MWIMGVAPTALQVVDFITTIDLIVAARRLHLSLQEGYLMTFASLFSGRVVGFTAILSSALMGCASPTTDESGSSEDALVVLSDDQIKQAFIKAMGNEFAVESYNRWLDTETTTYSWWHEGTRRTVVERIKLDGWFSMGVVSAEIEIGSIKFAADIEHGCNKGLARNRYGDVVLPMLGRAPASELTDSTSEADAKYCADMKQYTLAGDAPTKVRRWVSTALKEEFLVCDYGWSGVVRDSKGVPFQLYVMNPGENWKTYNRGW